MIDFRVSLLMIRFLNKRNPVALFIEKVELNQPAPPRATSNFSIVVGLLTLYVPFSTGLVRHGLPFAEIKSGHEQVSQQEGSSIAFLASAVPPVTLENIGISRFYADVDGPEIGDSNTDNADGDDFISIVNFGGAPVDISGWQLYTDQGGTATPVFSFPSSTVIGSCEVFTIIGDWNGSNPLPTNWFDANYVTSEGLFGDDPRICYAILRNPNTNAYIVFHHRLSAPTLSTGTLVGTYDFSPVDTDIDNCELVFWNAVSGAYEVEVDCGIYTSYTACAPAVEICNNNIDDDGDGLIDCADDDCPNSPSITRIRMN